MKKSLVVLITIAILSTFSGILARPVKALTSPDFASCPNPGGILKASFAEGTHGIAGESGTFVGSDSVYTLNSTQAVQCFCPSSGTGIQTNWLKLVDVSAQDIQTFKNLGWVFIPNGLEWGLDNASYVAQNLSFNCNGGGTVNGGGSAAASNWVCDSAKPPAPMLKSVTKTGTTATLNWTAVDMATHYLIFYGTQPGKWDFSVPNTGKVTTFTIGGLDPNTKYYFEVRSVNNCTPSDAPAVGGEVLGLSTEFAPTGTWALIAALAVAGVSLMGVSFFFRRHSTRG